MRRYVVKEHALGGPFLYGPYTRRRAERVRNHLAYQHLPFSVRVEVIGPLRKLGTTKAGPL